jgi:hypothetical protein
VSKWRLKVTMALKRVMGKRKRKKAWKGVAA